jgi:hypothetical protein
LTTKFALVDPPGTVTFDGTVATGVLLELSVTTAPPDGAGSVSVTVPVELLPPATAFGLKVRVCGTGGGVPQTFGVPAPPQISGEAQVPQANHPPAPSGIAPQFFPSSEHEVVGVSGPHTFAIPPPPQVREPLQVPQLSVPPQPSDIVLQFLPSEAQVTGAQVGGGITARKAASTPSEAFSAIPTITVPSAETALANTN